MAQSRLHAVYELGQSIWYDNIRRSVITSGELRRLMDQDAVVGVTSNPTIFEKAVSGSTDYDEALVRLVGEGQAPDQLMSERRDSNGKILRTRPLFPYPQVAKYKGSGSTDEAENFVSQPPAQ